ncbi:pogo transposable element with KRAB domain [Rhizophagus clarus]|uniref:Pogo transposable element with KRAB domain n=1 Tax=Rhizophagus clarus TaxID=94130 RepID=A0A8H3KZ66_9GLOM|nr:pogo transposable element with KRAB domain [Rhizophagus clarus]
MGPRANKRSNRSTVTEKKRRQWNAREKIAIIMYHENGHSAKLKYPALETVLVAWVKEKRKNQNAVTQSMIQVKAQALTQQRQWQVMYSGIRSFAFSNKWLDAYIRNMDETPVSFDLSANITVDELGARSVSIRTTGHERSNFTVVLTYMADGMKLLPLIIFKIKNIPQGNFPLEVIIRANKKGWMNENEMLYWIENVWAKRERFSNPQSLLVLDSFFAHIVDSSLDVLVNKSFKSKIQRYYNEWMAETIKELTPTGKFRRPSYETVAHWVKDSWDAVDINLIQRSFKCCRISNKRDRTEDDWFFNYDRLKQNNQLNDEVVVLSDNENESDEEYENDEDEEYDDEEEEDNEYEDDDDDDDEEEEEKEEDEYNEEEEESEYRKEEDGYDDEYFGYYEQGTNYVNI